MYVCVLCVCWCWPPPPSRGRGRSSPSCSRPASRWWHTHDSSPNPFPHAHTHARACLHLHWPPRPQALSCLTALGHAPGPRWLEVFASAADDQAARFSAPDLIRTVVLLHKAGAAWDPILLEALFASTAGGLRELDPSTLSQLVVTLKAAPRPPSRLWLEAFVGAAQDQLPKFSRPQLQDVLSTLRVLGEQRSAHRPQQGEVSSTSSSFDAVLASFTNLAREFL